MSDYDPALNASKSYDVAINAMREKLASFRCERIQDAVLYQGDCREVMALWPPCFRVGAVVTDPPYGIRVGSMGMGKGRKVNVFEKFDWDDRRPDNDFILALARHPEAIIWGGNYFDLPATGCLLMWDKVQEFSGASFETAWTNLKIPSKAFRLSRVEAYGSVPREHPTQKPLALMEWCIEKLSARTILDPFMGSGTTGVACAKLGRKFIGIELEPKYFDIACKRIDEAYRQPRLFKDEPPKPKQEALL